MSLSKFIQVWSTIVLRRNSEKIDVCETLSISSSAPMVKYTKRSRSVNPPSRTRTCQLGWNRANSPKKNNYTGASGGLSNKWTALLSGFRSLCYHPIREVQEAAMLKDQAYFYLLGPQTMVAAGDEALSGPGVKVGYLSLEKLKVLSPALGIADKLDRDFAQEPARLRNSIDVYADASIGIINIINMADMDALQDRIAFVVKKDLFLLAEIEDADGSVLRLFEGAVQRLQGGGTLERFIYAVLERLLSGSNRMLEDMEQRILKIERDLLGDDADRQLSRVIYACRQRLSLAYNYLEQLIDIAQELEENENEIFDRENLWHLGLFIGKAERISTSVQMIAESAVHLRESLDAVINYNLNRIMKILTVITAIFMPLTLIVGWYGMNFEHMPELSHPMAYPALGLVFVVVILVIVYVFKRKKFM